MSNEEVNQALKLITKDLAIDPSELSQTVDNLDELKQKLIPIIDYLLNSDMNRLLTALYRIDVDEHKVNKIITAADPDLIAARIADLIIKRELQKVLTRKKYSQGEN